MNGLQLLLLGAGALVLLAAAYPLAERRTPARQAQRRLEAVRLRHCESTTAKVESQLKKAIALRRPASRQASGSGSLREALALRLERTGRKVSVSTYFYGSLGLAAVIALIIWLLTGTGFLALCIGVLVGAGVPHFLVDQLIRRHVAAFNARFPEAIELLVRGLRSGLPVAETFTVIAREVPGPAGAEFRAAVERIRIGRTMEQALQAAADRIGTPEFQFFVIALAIQRETGGNLAETLSNLADVLRKRSQMKLKIRAMSSESKASAYIVGALPFLVSALIVWLNPAYMSAFVVDERLMVVGLGGLAWLAIGAFIMARMVSFEF